MVSFSTVLFAAVKRTLNSRGGVIWKTHAFATPSKTARANAKKRRAYVDEVRAVLKKAESLQKAAQAGASAAAAAAVKA